MRNCVFIKIIVILILFVTNTNCNANGNYTIEKDTIVPNKHSIKNSSLLKTAGTAPDIRTIGDQIYCPGIPLSIVQSVTIYVDSTDPPSAVYIQISSGYATGDNLALTGTHPTISSIWIPSEGKLKFTGPGLSNSATIKNAIESVVYNNSSASVSGARTFSISLGSGTLSYLPRNKHFYEYVEYTGIKWSEAKTAAAIKTYYGLQGYLATLTAADEAKLAGEQAPGAGWIGGSDAASEGTWKWVTGPEAGTLMTYTNWNNNEPNNTGGDEDYAHVTDPDDPDSINGAWNDLSDTGDLNPGFYQPKGYIVEYGDMTPGDVDNIHTSDFTTITISTITSPTPNPVCDSGVFNLSADASIGIIKWYDAPIGGTLVNTGNTFTTPNLTLTKTYYLDAGCPGTRTPVTATVYPLPNLRDITIVQCSETPNYSTFNLSVKNKDISLNFFNETFTYYKILAGGILELIPNYTAYTNTSPNETVWARIANKVTGCFSIAKIDLIVSVTQLDPTTFHENLEICDDALPNDQDGFSEFDFNTVTTAIKNKIDPLSSNSYSIKYYSTEADALSEINGIPNPSSFRNTIKDNQDIWVRIDSDLDNSCFGIGTYVTLIVKPVPNINLNTNGVEDVWVCDNLPNYFVTLTAGIQAGLTPSNYDYIWKKDGNPNPVGTNLSTLDVYSEGVYTVEVIDKSFGCSRTRTITVKPSNSATIMPFKIVDLADENSVTVMVTGLGSYEYSLDEPFGPWQNSNVFDNVSAGIHDVYINDKNGCGSVNETIAVIGAPKFFTPNNDGYNDYWSVEGISGTFNSKSIIYIYDRYGKLLKQWVPTINQGWNGTFNGIPLPADDYWFTLKLEDGREAKGHFSLKR
jgi:gliding motility-associated-like protein